MKTLLNLFLLLITFFNTHNVDAQNFKLSFRSFISSTLLNKNVYNTNSNLTLTPVYQDNGRIRPSKQPNLPINDSNTFTLQPAENSVIRYKVLKVDPNDKSLYIRILPGCKIDSTQRIISSVNTSNESFDASNFVFKVKSGYSPNQSFLASSALIGHVLTLPVRIRSLESALDDFSINFNLSYAFGWKFKLGVNPYRSHFLLIIPYAFGFSNQKHFMRLEDGLYSGKVDQFALTYNCQGISYEYENFNIGFFVGQDRMFGNNQDWVFNKKWWLGIGLGYKLFTN